MLIKIYMAYVVLIVINFRLLRNVTAWLWLWAPGWGSLQCLQWPSTDTRIHPWYVQVLTHHSQHPGVLILIPVCCHVLHKHLNQTFQSWQKWQRWREVNSGLFVSCSVLGSGADVEPACGEAPCPAPVALLAVPGPRWHCGEDKTCLTTGEQQLSWGLWQLLTDLSGYCDVLEENPLKYCSCWQYSIGSYCYAHNESTGKCLRQECAFTVRLYVYFYKWEIKVFILLRQWHSIIISFFVTSLNYFSLKAFQRDFIFLLKLASYWFK